MKSQNQKLTTAPEFKIMCSIISCKTFEQLNACRDWCERINWAGKPPEFFEFAFIDQTRRIAKDGLDI